MLTLLPLLKLLALVGSSIFISQHNFADNGIAVNEAG